ncbi:unnamed protein product [Ophioblennius macclurei]
MPEPEPTGTPLQPDPDPAGSSTTHRQESQRLKPRMAVPSGDRSFYKQRKSAGEWIHPLHSTPQLNCTKGRIKHVVQGNFYAPGQLQANIQSMGFQSDSAAPVPPHRGRPRVRGQRVSSPEESWQRLQPTVECGDDSMTLTVRKRRAIQLQLDRANESSLPLFQLSPHCGYSVQTTWRDLSLKSQYDACHITQEDDSYVLPLLWRGTPVRMSCPVSQVALQPEGPSSLCCSPYGLRVKIPGLSAADEYRVNVRGEWTPLVVLAEQCGYTLDRQGDETVISAPFVTCGVTMKDEKYTLTLAAGNEVFLLACPVAPLEQLPVSHQPLLNSPPHVHSMPATPILGSLEPFPWAPPFYLAPPHYPHPTSHSTSPPHSSNSPTPPTLPHKTFRPRPHPGLSHQHKISPHEHLNTRTSPSPVDEIVSSGGSHLDTTQDDKKQNQETVLVEGQHSSTPTGFPSQVEAPHAPPPRHDYSPYYHFYHHPKIPLRSTPPQEPDPGPQPHEESSASKFQTPELPALRPSDQQAKGFGRVGPDKVFPPVHRPPPNPHMVLTNAPFPHKEAPPHPPPPPLPYPYYYFHHFPHVAGEAKRLALSHPDKATKTIGPDSPLPPLHEHNTKPLAHDAGEEKSEQSAAYSPFLTKDVKPVTEDVMSDAKTQSSAVETAVQRSFSHGADPTIPPPPPPPEQPSPPRSAIHYESNPYQYYYHHPYYDYYLMYYGPEGSFNVFNGEPQTPQKTSTPQTGSPFLDHSTPIRSPYDFQNGEGSPYFYYYHNYYPNHLKVFRDDRQLPPLDGKESAEAPPQSDAAPPAKFEYSSMEWFVRESGRPSISQPTFNSFLNFYGQDPSQQHGPAGAQERLDNEMDHLKAGVRAHSASPCGFDPVSDPECGNSLDCCMHNMQDCTVGQYFIFVVPDSVLEPTVVPTAQSSEDDGGGGEPCTVQRLTSDLDIYIVPLDGCGVNKHIFGDTILHLLEVQGTHPYDDGNSAHDILPVRLTVGCSSSPDSPGEVMFHVMDQLSLPQPTPAAIFVRLRIATDESFTGYHPETHLPLSRIQGRPVYVELSLVDPSEPSLVLLVHSCLAYTQEPYASWMLVYDGCQSQGASQLLPSPTSHHIQRITISSFLPLPPESSLHATKRGHSLTEDPEIYFMCLTEVCNTAESDCALTCFKSPPSHTQAMK